jgi:hypothetical protein
MTGDTMVEDLIQAEHVVRQEPTIKPAMAARIARTNQTRRDYVKDWRRRLNEAQQHARGEQ